LGLQDIRAFSSEVDTGSRQENASKPKTGLDSGQPEPGP
jgi:hypothetical protein